MGYWYMEMDTGMYVYYVYWSEEMDNIFKVIKTILEGIKRKV